MDKLGRSKVGDQFVGDFATYPFYHSFSVRTPPAQVPTSGLRCLTCHTPIVNDFAPSSGGVCTLVQNGSSAVLLDLCTLGPHYLLDSSSPD